MTAFKPVKSFLLLSTAIAAANASVVAHAEDRLAIEEVIVTAERREANLQEVPVAVSSFSADNLQAAQVTDLGDLQAMVPNLSVHVGDANNAVVFIRGIGQIDSVAFFEPGVGIYLDDVYLGRAQGAFLDVVDVERIEVLRGPQGSLYGRNSVGGAVKYVSAAPTQELSGNVSATVGNYNRRDLKLSVSGGLSDTLAGRLTVASLHHEGFSENLFDGERDGDRDTVFARGVLQYEPRDDLQFTLAVDYTEADPDHSRTPSKETPINVLLVGEFPKDNDPFTVNADFNDVEFTETQGVSLHASWDINDQWSFKSISSYRELDYGTEVDLDATPINAFGIFYYNEQSQTSQEFQLQYQSDRANAVVGLYYFNEDGSTFDGGVFANIFSASAGRASFETESYALFGQLDYDLNDALTLIAGFRYTEESKSYARVAEAYDLIALSALDAKFLNPSSTDLRAIAGQGFVTTGNPDDADFSNFSPKLGVKYQLSDTTNMYASISTAFKAGGFNGRVTSDALEPFDEETLISYEVGLKTQLWDDRLRINSAVFYNEYEDLQLSRFEATEDGASILPVFTNAGEAVMQGVELEVTAVISEGLTASLNLGYLDSEYKEYTTVDPVSGQTIDISDQRSITNAPEWDTQFGLRYDFPEFSWGQLSLVGDISYRSKTYLEVNSQETLAQGGYSVSNAALLLSSTDGSWQASIGGKNLGDKRYRTHAVDISSFPGVMLGYYNPPRTVSANISYNF
jgi:iron complex outermembrane receptor protein